MGIMFEEMSMEDFFHLANRLVSQMGFKVKTSVYREDVAVFDAHMPIPGKALHYVIVFFKRPVVRGEDIQEMMEETVEVRWMFITTGDFENVESLRAREDVTLMNSSDLNRLLREFGIEEEMDRAERGQEAREGRYLPSVGEYESMLQWAEDFFNSGNYKMALDYADRAISIKGTPRAMKMKARILHKMGRQEEAIEILKEVLDQDVEDDEAWFILGEILEDMGDEEEAEGAYARCLKFNHRNLGCWANRGNVLLSMGRYNEALLCYERAISIRSDLPLLWNNKGVALKYLGRYDEALQSYNMALRFDPNFLDAHLNKAILYFDLRRYEEAQNSLSHALSIEENHVPSMLLLARIYMKRNMEREAQELLRKVLQLDPANQEARELLKKLSPGDSTIQPVVSEEAMYHILYEENSLPIPGEHAYNSLGLQLMEQGKYELASLHFRIALKMNPDFREAQYNLARALKMMGRKKESKLLLEELGIKE